MNNILISFQIQDLNSTIREKEREITDLKKNLEEKTLEISTLKNFSPALKYQIESAAQREAELDQRITILGMLLKQFTIFRNSLSIRLNP